MLSSRALFFWTGLELWINSYPNFSRFWNPRRGNTNKILCFFLSFEAFSLIIYFHGVLNIICPHEQRRAWIMREIHGLLCFWFNSTKIWNSVVALYWRDLVERYRDRRRCFSHCVISLGVSLINFNLSDSTSNYEESWQSHYRVKLHHQQPVLKNSSSLQIGFQFDANETGMDLLLLFKKDKDSNRDN